METKFTTIDEYIASYSGAVRQRLEQVRQAIKTEVPAAKEKISYGIPTFDLHGNLVHFAGYDHHVGFYPGASGILFFEKEFRGFECSKGTVRFPHDRELPLDLVRKIVQFRVKENLEKAAKKKKIS